MTLIALLFITTLALLSCEDETQAPSASCLEHQEAFNGSCYEFLSGQRSFVGGQAWCEQAGGHLAFILTEETQNFFQKHLHPERDWWLGLAPFFPDRKDPYDGKGALSWLDGSYINYSKWVSGPLPGAECGFILRNSAFSWKATGDCSQELHFVCQYEPGRSIVCSGRSTTLQCPPGQVIAIDGGFYGRKVAHYCRATPPPRPTPTPDQCGFTDVSHSLAGQCDGLRICRAASIPPSFEPCPGLGSYLSVNYHCEDGLRLAVSSLGVVLEHVAITVKLLRRAFRGNLTCRLTTGDGGIIYLQLQDQLESSVVHTYLSSRVFVLRAECGSGETHAVAQGSIAVQQRVGRFGVVTCHAGGVPSAGAACKALEGSSFEIQLEVDSGTNVTYRVQSGEVTLVSSAATCGRSPHNVTLSSEVVEQLGPGCHALTLRAANMVTRLAVSRDLQVCVLERVAGLSAAVSAERGSRPGCPDLSVVVSLAHGSPVTLLFFLTGNNSSVSESREMMESTGLYHIRNPFRGALRVRLRAWNVFSSAELNLADCASGTADASRENTEHGNDVLKWNKALDKARLGHSRVRRDAKLKVTATPKNSVTAVSQILLVEVTKGHNSDDDDLKAQWGCQMPCICQRKGQSLKNTVTEGCLPGAVHYSEYTFKVKEKGDNVKDSESQCVTFTLPKFADVQLSCFQGCSPVKVEADVKVKLNCQNCPTVVWNVEEPGKIKGRKKRPKGCSNKATKLIEKQDGGNEYTVKPTVLVHAQSKKEDVTVVAYRKDPPGYAKLTIKVPSSHMNTDSTESSDTTSDSSEWSDSAPDSTESSDTTSDSSEWSDTAPDSSESSDTIPDHTASPKPALSTSPTPPSSPTSAGAPFSLNTQSPGGQSANPIATTTSSTSGDFEGLTCSISPQNGTVLNAFNITCETKTYCSNCQYCFETSDGIHLRCSNEREVRSLYLPLGASATNYMLSIVATVRSSSGPPVSSTNISAQVQSPPGDSSSSVRHLKSAVQGAVANLEEQGLLSGGTIGQMFLSVSNILNRQSDETQKGARQELREKMLRKMVATVEKVPSKSPQEVLLTAKGLAAIIKKGDELSSSSQEAAALLVSTLSSSLFSADVDAGNSKEMLDAAAHILQAASNIYDYSSNKIVSDMLLGAFNNLQDAFLKEKKVNGKPTFVHRGHIGLLVNRVTPQTLSRKSIAIPQKTSPVFTLPPLLANILPAGDPVDIRMLSFTNNPFSWSGNGNVSGVIGALSFTRGDGSNIPVTNLAEEIEILLPRPAEEQVVNSFLDLRNYSTMVIYVPSSDSTLVLKIEPSVDPLPLKLLLGHNVYPTAASSIATTQMPRQGPVQDERYTWLLGPDDFRGNTGVHYLVVQPVVGPGIKSVNASVNISVVASHCKHWNKAMSDWSNRGCRVGVRTTSSVTQCLCNHLTFFGSSFFVTPALIDLSRTAELFGTFAQNPVVVCFVGALFLAYLVAVMWARRKDIQDAAKVKVTVLEDNNPLDDYRYMLCVCTGHRYGACTSSQVTITLMGSEGESAPHHLTDPEKCAFERGAKDMFLLTTPFALGDLLSVRLWHDNSGAHPAWYVNSVVVKDLQTEEKWHFLCDSWLTVDVGDCTLDKMFPVATEMDLKRFSNLFFAKTARDFNDRHLWFSVVSCPPGSTFSRVQRVSCCFSLLHCTMLTSIMFYGVPQDPSEQTMDLGHFEFTWQQFMIGIESSLIMFPLNLLIGSIFRCTRPRETSCSKAKPEACGWREIPPRFSEPAAFKTEVSSISADSLIQDIIRIANSLSKTVKGDTAGMETELESGQKADLTAVLSVVEDIIREHVVKDDAAVSPQSKTNRSEKQDIPGPQTPDHSVGVDPEKAADGVQMNGVNRTEHLHRQICHIDKKLRLVEPSGFADQTAYDHAVQQVQGMKGLFAEKLRGDQLLDSSHAQHPVAQGTEGNGRCCQRGLPWWFVFVGWLLVILTSCGAAFFTMLYGLKFGKERSISWLVSMMISFFQSLLIIQPLKVVGFAVFFALVLKKVDEENDESPPFVKINRKPDDPLGAACSDSRLYAPPSPVDIERMRRNQIKEQKACALIKEILTYFGFMWMLLVVTYSQRDPNAFFLSKHIRRSFGSGVSDSMSLGEVFIWANTTLLGNLFGTYPGFITDGNSKLVGSARLRQVRVQKSRCHVARSMRHLVPDCHALYSWEAEDTGSYHPGWNRSVTGDVSQSRNTPWEYQTQARLRAHSIWGKAALYRGGGFAVDLGPDRQNGSSTLEYLFRNTWLDIYTRAIFVEFTVYNANVNLFCVITLMLETAATGAFQFRSELQSLRLYPSTGGLHVFVLTEILYFLFIIYYMFLQCKLMKQQRWSYFRGKWNLLELAIILLSWSALSITIKRTVLGSRDMAYYRSHKDQFVNFHETAMADSALGYVLAFLVLLATVKLWHLLRLNPKLNMITSALQRAGGDMAGFLLIIAVMLLAYSITCNLLYGWTVSSYRTLMDAVLTLIRMQLGIFNYNEVLEHNMLLGAFLIGSCVILMTFVVLNLFVSVILMAFSQEQIHHKPSDEEEIVELLLMKLRRLLGMSVKETKDSSGAEVNAASGSAPENDQETSDMNTENCSKL